jgi:hypothetical protein
MFSNISLSTTGEHTDQTSHHYYFYYNNDFVQNIMGPFWLYFGWTNVHICLTFKDFLENVSNWIGPDSFLFLIHCQKYHSWNVCTSLSNIFTVLSPVYVMTIFYSVGPHLSSLSFFKVASQLIFLFLMFALLFNIFDSVA